MSDEHYPGEADCAMTDHAQLDTVEQLRVRAAELETELEEYRHLAETVGASKAIAERNTAWTRDDTMNDTTKTDPITDILTERGKTYGPFVDLAEIAQVLKDEIRAHIVKRKTDLSFDQQEALDMICTKIARIVNGDPNHIDDWDDIAGFARLVADRLRGVVR